MSILSSRVQFSPIQGMRNEFRSKIYFKLPLWRWPREHAPIRKTRDESWMRKGKRNGGGEDRRWIVFRLKIPRLGTIRNPRSFFLFFFFVKRYCCIDFEGKLMKFHFHAVFYFFISLSVLFVPVNRFDFNCFN